jgi:hypothetical protein
MKFTTGIILGLIIALGSCTALPSVKSWSLVSSKQKGSTEIGTIRVDKNAGWDSVEAETARLLPLLLAEERYLYSNTENRYRVDAVLIEREYMKNWKTRRSLSAEIIIWEKGKALPTAAGKAILTDSTKSLSSSKTLHKLLNSALLSALRGLPKK